MLRPMCIHMHVVKARRRLIRSTVQTGHWAAPWGPSSDPSGSAVHAHLWNTCKPAKYACTLSLLHCPTLKIHAKTQWHWLYYKTTVTPINVVIKMLEEVLKSSHRGRSLNEMRTDWCLYCLNELTLWTAETDQALENHLVRTVIEVFVPHKGAHFGAFSSKWVTRGWKKLAWGMHVKENETRRERDNQEKRKKRHISCWVTEEWT